MKTQSKYAKYATKDGSQDYNGTAIYRNASGRAYCVAMVGLVGGQVYRSNGLWTCNNGKAAYANDWARHSAGTLAMEPGSRVELVQDGTRAYMVAACEGFDKV